jgi:single-strand DNA-binding protein
MPTLNKVQLIGRLGKDPEVRTLASGKKVASFQIAVDYRWRASDGEMKESTDWIGIEAWGRMGEICQQYLTKGRLIYLEGRLQIDRYEQNGETRYFTKVVARDMQILDKRDAEIIPEVEPEENTSK